MSLNCKGLRARNGKSKKGKAHASTLARRSMLAKIVNQHKPQVLALQETWHLPHNDSMQVKGYWYYGRPRVTPDGKRTTSGGVGFLVSNKFGMGNVKQREHADEAGSTGMLWLDLMLADRSWVSVGNIYSECDNKTSLMGLKMKDVWEARGKTITGILAEDGSSRPVFIVGDFNVHLRTSAGLPPAKAGQKSFAEPCRAC